MTSVLRQAGEYSQISIPLNVRHQNVSLSALADENPTKYDPVAIPSGAVEALHGTVVVIDAPIAVVDVTPGSVHRHNVRNVATYESSEEATFAAIEEGTLVYYDPSPTMPDNVYLSCSPLDASDAENCLFGVVVLDQDESESDFPKGSTSAGGSYGCAVMQL